MSAPFPIVVVAGVYPFGPKGFAVHATQPAKMFLETREGLVWASEHCTLEDAEAVADALRRDPERLRAAWESTERPDRKPTR